MWTETKYQLCVLLYWLICIYAQTCHVRPVCACMCMWNAIANLYESKENVFTGNNNKICMANAYWRWEKKAADRMVPANWNVIWNLYFYQNTPIGFMCAFQPFFSLFFVVVVVVVVSFAFIFLCAVLELVLFVLPQASRIYFPFIQANEWRGNILLCFFVSASLLPTHNQRKSVRRFFFFFRFFLWLLTCVMAPLQDIGRSILCTWVEET